MAFAIADIPALEPLQRPFLQQQFGHAQDSVNMFVSKTVSLLCCLSWALGLPSWVSPESSSSSSSLVNQQLQTNAANQSIVTYDQHSVYINGKRILLYNAEFHAYRLPVTGLWLDIFQKLKSAGFSGVSFYTDWALLEGKPGNFSAQGIFALEPFFDAAKKAGIYLVARPGPYINAESSGGGFPGWLQRSPAISRTPDFLPSTANYVKNVGQLIAKAQITNGGPVILVQPENEYTQATSNVQFPNKQYFADTEQMLRDAGITVPFVSNDASPRGLFAPGTGQGAVDIYGHDSYPLGFDCSNPTNWPNNALPTNFWSLHEQQSPTTPYTISEFQGGAFDPWGGVGFAKCTALTGPEFERVFFKNNYGPEVTIFNIYMGFGGTNWGNLGHPGGYTSYDYGAAIAEDRTVAREKYSEIKLQANFLHASPAYLYANGSSAVAGGYVNTQDITTTRLTTNSTDFYIVRHSNYASTSATSYKLNVTTSKGQVSVPQLSSSLTLNGRDSKIHVTDYDLGGINLLYSSAEIFTWKKYADKTVLVLYGGANETHEAAFVGQTKLTTNEGTAPKTATRNGALIVNWATSPNRSVVTVGQNLFVYLLDRNSAYSFWVLDAASNGQTPYTGTASTSLIVNGGYLLRNASISGTTVALSGDLNRTTNFEVIGGAPNGASLTFNGQKVQTKQSSNGVLSGTVNFGSPKVSLADLSSAKWRYINSLPEIQTSYDDLRWVSANHNTSNNTVAPLKTPVSLYGSDYGFHTGNLLFRGRFTATGKEKTLNLTTQGGTAYASAIWLNGTLVSSFPGNSASASYSHVATLPSLTAGKSYVLTVLIDNMGLDEDFTVGSDGNKNPRGILAYSFPTSISWKLTGNLGGENFADPIRGPLNEGGLFAERQGYHLPNPPTTAANGWSDGSPLTGISAPGVGFWSTTFSLNLPAGYDIPLAFQFTNSSSSSAGAGNYRAQLYANGYQFGKYVNNIGPQTQFPVPQGVLNYNGNNTLAISLWGFDKGGNKLSGLTLVNTAVVQSGYGAIANSPMPAWVKRTGAY